MGRPAGPARDTKRIICEQALDIFAEKGYVAATMKDIARACDMKDASLYNHFPSKQALFDAVIERQLTRLEDLLHGSRAVASPEDDAGAYLTVDRDELVATVLASYEPFFADSQLVRLRHVLETARHADAACDRLFRLIFVERTLELQRTIFARLIETGIFAPCGVGLAARQFHGPVFLTLSEGMAWEDARAFIEAHLDAFQADHRRKE